MDNSVFSAGDTMFIDLSIINNGPDDIQEEDTFVITNDETLVYMLMTNFEIPAGTSLD